MVTTDGRPPEAAATLETPMNRTTIAVVALLAGGAAIAAYNQSGFGTPYADVVSATPVTVKEPVYGDVLAVQPVTQVVQGTQQVCTDQVVTKRRAERFGNKDGAVAGAVVGGLIGSQIGGGKGKTAATVAGVVGGAYAGREIDRRHQGGQTYTDTERVCRNEPTSSTQTVGYDVQYRTEDGQTLTRRESSKPGERLLLGEKDVTIGYDVAWRYKEQTGVIRMDELPGERLPMQDGAILVAAKPASPPNG
jgi:uncharacterized protein YcfJ